MAKTEIGAARSSSLKAFAGETARAMDGRIERMATTANNIANETSDQRWNRLALALRAARRLARELIIEHREGTAQAEAGEE